MFSADDDEQWQVITQTIDSSDYYILILGHRYGSLTKEGISYTEKEFDYAKKTGVPILSFIQNRNAATKPEHRENDTNKIEKLNCFYEKARAAKMCDSWENKDDLAKQVAVALFKFMRKSPRNGWIRRDERSINVTQELARLSKENSELKKEIETYKNERSQRRPKLEVELSTSATEEIQFVEPKELNIQFNPITEVPSHLQEYVSQDDITEYNSSLPSREFVNKLNRDLKLYDQIANHAYDIEIRVSNSGNVPANGVFIDIQFPSDLLIFDEYQWGDYPAPEYIPPKNPLTLAEEQYEKDKKRALNSIGRMLDSYEPLTQRWFESTLPVMTNFPQIGSRFETVSVDVENNIVTVEIKKLIHTREFVFKNLKVVPLRSGDFSIEVSSISEELEKSIESVLTFNVSSSNLTPST